MDTTERSRAVASAARWLIDNDEPATLATIARWGEAYRGLALRRLSDTAFAKFAADVERERAAQVQEAADIAAMGLGR